jgi:hypothetical protein
VGQSQLLEVFFSLICWDFCFIFGFEGGSRKFSLISILVVKNIYYLYIRERLQWFICFTSCHDCCALYRGQGREIAQTMYAHMNKFQKKEKEKGN